MREFIWIYLLDLRVRIHKGRFVSCERRYMVLNNHLEHGLTDSPKYLKQDGYSQTQADHVLLVKHFTDGRITILIVYVDDILLTGNHEGEMRRLKMLLSKEFEIKDLGHLKYFLGDGSGTEQQRNFNISMQVCSRSLTRDRHEWVQTC